MTRQKKMNYILIEEILFLRKKTFDKIIEKNNYKYIDRTDNNILIK